jgi:hypothetical protein
MRAVAWLRRRRERFLQANKQMRDAADNAIRTLMTPDRRNARIDKACARFRPPPDFNARCLENTSRDRRPGLRFPDQRCSAKRCTADPGSLRTPRLLRSRVSSAPLRCATCCAAPGKRVAARLAPFEAPRSSREGAPQGAGEKEDGEACPGFRLTQSGLRVLKCPQSARSQPFRSLKWCSFPGLACGA